MPTAEEPTGPPPGAAPTKGFGASQSWRRTAAEVGVVIAGIVALIFALRGCSGCLSTTITERLPPQADEKIGKVGGEAMRARYGALGAEPTPEQRARAERIWDELRGALTPEESKILVMPRFTVVKDDQVNAFAMPGGEVFVLTGLLDRTQGDDSMLAGVIAHELGHAVRRHGVRGLVRNAVYAVGLTLILGGSDDAIATLVAGASQLDQLGHTRSMEEEADEFGVDLMKRTGKDVEGLARFLESLESVPVPELLSTHPDSGGRAKAIRERARAK